MGTSGEVGSHFGDGEFGGASGADEGRRREPGPVAVAEQVQAGMIDRAGAHGGRVPVFQGEVERGEVVEVRGESGAPDDRIAHIFLPVAPRHTSWG